MNYFNNLLFLSEFLARIVANVFIWINVRIFVVVKDEDITPIVKDEDISPIINKVNDFFIKRGKFTCDVNWLICKSNKY